MESDSHWERLESTKATISHEATTIRKDTQYVNNYLVFVKEYNLYLRRKKQRIGELHIDIAAFPLSYKLTELYIVFLSAEARYFTSSVETLHLNSLKRYSKANSWAIDSSVSQLMSNMVGVINHMNFDSVKPSCIRHPILEADLILILDKTPFFRADKRQSFALFCLAIDSGMRSISIRSILLEDFISLTVLEDGMILYFLYLFILVLGLCFWNLFIYYSLLLYFLSFFSDYFCII
jgi:hypothetical protein